MTTLNEADAIYIGGVAASKVYLGNALVWPAGPPPVEGEPDVWLVTAYTPLAPTIRNDFTGEVGLQINMIANKTVSWIGLKCVTGNSGIRTINLYDWATVTLLRTVDFDFTGKTGGVWYWQPIEPITLVSGTSYFLGLETTAGGQFWHEVGPTTVDPALATNPYGTYRFPAAAPTAAHAGSQYVGVNVGWDIPSNLWTPDMLLNLDVWLDASQDAFADGAVISSYTEHSANARVLTSVATHEPIFRTNYAGKKRLDFIGAHTPALTINPYAPTSGGLTFIVSCRLIATTYIGMLVTYNGTAASYELRYSDYSLTTMLVANYTANGAASVVVSSANDTPDVEQIHISEFVPAGITKLWLDGTTVGSSSTPAAQTTTPADLNIGKRADGAHYLGHYINEVFVIGDRISVADRERVEGYLAHKWGSALPVGHPYKDEPPTAPTGPSESLVTAYTPGTDRNDFSGQVGVRLGIGTKDISTNWLGARSNGIGGTRTVHVYEWFTDTQIAVVTIDYTGKAAGEWAWTAMPPLKLLAGGYYAVMMDVVAGDGNWWKNPGSVTMLGMANVYDTYRAGAGALATGLANSQFIGLDLGRS